jgi:hypothetical protein
MAYIPQNWPIIIRNYLLGKCTEAIVNKIMEKIASKLGLQWDSISSFSNAAGQVVTGTNIPAQLATAATTYLQIYLFTASMPATYKTDAIPKYGKIWAVDPYPKNPYNPNVNADQYVEFLVFSWAYSYIQCNRQYAEPIYRFD